ncbi:MAG: hypothetical protein KA436_08060 [Oligoflexales bacterium]|nr:hypothetical protein [Oligoflexales bacterium]
MSSKLQLSHFIDLQSTHSPSTRIRFPDSPFDLLGKNLLLWLEELLHELGVKSSLLNHGEVSPQAAIEGSVYIAKGAIVEPFAYIKGPAYIGPEAKVRHGAFIRDGAYIGKKAVVGHTTEVKGSVFFDGAKASHFAYVGDSILGCKVNLGAGTKLANLKLKADEIYYLDPQTGLRCASGLRKFGSILGDGAQTGCNSVLSPGSLLLPHTHIYPAVHFHGTLKPRAKV